MKKSSKKRIPDSSGRADIMPNCPEVVKSCNAACCRTGGGVALTRQEIESGLYQTETFCIERKQPCVKKKSCYHKIIQIKALEDRCIYLSEENLCLIHDRKPRICREYVCATGKIREGKKDIHNFLDRESLRINRNLVFARDPGRKLSRVIIHEEQHKIFLLISDSSLCEDIMAGGVFFWKNVSEDYLLKVYESFNGAKKLGIIEKEVELYCGPDSSMPFRHFVILLAGQRLLVNRMR